VSGSPHDALAELRKILSETRDLKRATAPGDPVGGGVSVWSGQFPPLCRWPPQIRGLAWNGARRCALRRVRIARPVVCAHGGDAGGCQER
jgi:hypothetical protein